MRARSMGSLLFMLCAFFPAVSWAQLTVRSGHESTIRVRGDARGYARVSATRPLSFEAVGPGQLTVVLRQELESDQSIGRTTTRVALRAGSRVVESFNLTGSTLGAFDGRSPGSRPTEALEQAIDVPAGAIEYTILVETAGHQALVSIGFVPDQMDDLALMPLVPLAGPGDAIDELALVPLTGPDDGSDELSVIPLASLTDDEDEDLPLVALVPLTDDDGSASRPQSGRDVQVAMVTDGEGLGQGAVIGKPIRERRVRPPRSTYMVLGLRGLAAATGMGGNTVGGGVDLFLDNGLMNKRLAFGLSADLVSYTLIINRYQLDGSVARSNFGVNAIPVMAAANYVLPFALGPLKLQVTAGLGPVLANVSDDMRSANAVLFGGMIAAGPRLELGPGALSLAVRASGGYGSISDHRGVLIMRGPVGGLMFTAGYMLSI